MIKNTLCLIWHEHLGLFTRLLPCTCPPRAEVEPANAHDEGGNRKEGAVVQPCSGDDNDAQRVASPGIAMAHVISMKTHKQFVPR